MEVILKSFIDYSMIFNDCSPLSLAIFKKKLSTEHRHVHHSQLAGRNCWECRKLERPVSTKIWESPEMPKDAKSIALSTLFPEPVIRLYRSWQPVHLCGRHWSNRSKISLQRTSSLSVRILCKSLSSLSSRGPNRSSAAKSSRLLMSFSHEAHGTPSKRTMEHKLHKDNNDLMPSYAKLTQACTCNAHWKSLDKPCLLPQCRHALLERSC